MTVFGATYAQFYDALYVDKDYKAECDSIQKIIESKISDFISSAGDGKIDILDAGCGTGNHSHILSQNPAYNLTGLDRSEAMLQIANKKIPNMSFVIGDIRHIDQIFGDKTFDVVLTMAAVLCYLTDTDDLITAFNAAKKALKPGGLYIFDVWFGPGVCYLGTKKSYKDIIIDNKLYVRKSESSLDIMQNTCEVRYSIYDFTDNVISENHLVRYYFPVEIKFLLEKCGFRLLKMGQSPDYDLELDNKCWHMMVVAQSI